MKIIIAGAGIGGLTVSLCAQQAGHEVILLESAEELLEVGAGIQVPPNAMKVLDKLGVGEAVRTVGVEPEALTARMGVSGRTVFRVPLTGPTLARWGAAYVHVHRADYVRALSERLEHGVLRMGAEILDWYTHDSGVEVRLASGESLVGDVLVGADGIHSTVRSQMLGHDAARFTGNVAWRAVVPLERLGEMAPRK